MSGWARLGRLDLGDHLGVRVIARVVGREIGGGRRRGRRERGGARENEEQGESEGEARERGGAWTHHGRPRGPRYAAMGPGGRTGTDRPGNPRPRSRSLGPQRTAPPGPVAPREDRRWPARSRRAGAALGAALLVIALAAAPALACGGLIGPNGAVNLLRTTTLAGYHDGAGALHHRVPVRGWRRRVRVADATPRDPVERREGRRLDAPAPRPRDRAAAAVRGRRGAGRAPPAPPRSS